MADTVRLTVPSNPKYLSLVRLVSAKMAELHGLGEAATEEIRLAVDEACANVIKHAYRGAPDKEMTIAFSGDESGFAVTIDDEGIRAEPEKIEGRPLDEVRPGGLGVHLIRKAFDVVSFDRSKPTGNRLLLYRRRDR